MRLLLSYCFGYREANAFLVRAFSAQPLTPLPLGTDRLAVVQVPFLGWRPPPQFGEGGIPVLPVFGRELNMSMLRNAAIEYALAYSYDAWLDGDLDRVLVIPPSRIPETGYSTIPLFLGEGSRTHKETILSWKEGRLNRSLSGSSFFLVALQHLKNKAIRFFEGYEGYGYEDVDFNEAVCAKNGIYQSPTDAQAVHLWHPQRPWFSREKFEANRKLFEERRV